MISGNFYMLFLSWLTLINFALYLITWTKYLGFGTLGLVTVVYVYISSYARSKWACVNFTYIETTTIVPFLILKSYTIYQYMKRRLAIYQKYGEKINEDIANEIIKNPNYSGKHKISILSSHINTSTALHGDVSKSKMEEVMESIEDFTNDLIIDLDGTIEKSNGEETIAYRGQPIKHPNHAQVACMTILEMQKKLDSFNNRKTILQLKVIAGIRTDVAKENQMWEKIKEAQILEELNDYYKTNILIGKQTVSKLWDNFIVRHVDTINNNKQFKKLEIHELIWVIDWNIDTPFVPDEATRNIISNHKKAFELYQKGDFKSALELFETNYREYDDVTALVFIDRIEKMKKAPKGWDGVFELNSSDNNLDIN